MTIFSKRHSRLTGNDLHGIVWKEVANTAARLALTVFSYDKDKVVRQLDDGSLWVLSDPAVPTWVEVTAVGVAAVTSVAGRTGDVTLTSADVPDLGTAAVENVGTATGDVVQLENVGGSPGLPAVDGSQLTGIVSGGGSAISVHNESGVELTTDVTKFRFAGSVVVTEPVADEITVTVTPGASPVASVFSRTGAVVAAASDYNASQIDNDSVVPGAFVDDALNQLETEVTAAQADATQALANAALAQADATNAKTKTDRITVTQAVNLDTIESDTATNNSKISYTDAATVAASAGKLVNVTAISVAGAALIDDADNTAQRTTLGLGSAAVENVGATIGDVVQLGNVGGSPGLPAVDGSQLTGIVAAGGSISVQEEGVPVVTEAGTMNFTGGGVTVADVGGVATVTIAPGAAPIDTVFGRTGTVVAVSGDYTSNLVDNDSTVAAGAGSVTTALNQLATDIANKTVDVVSNVASGVILGRDSVGSGPSEELTPTEVRTLLGIEAGATADQTGAEIKALYEAEANTNAFTDAEQSKLAGIEALADVTDTANVTAAGALMDSEVASLAGVKAMTISADGNDLTVQTLTATVGAESTEYGEYGIAPYASRVTSFTIGGTPQTGTVVDLAILGMASGANGLKGGKTELWGGQAQVGVADGGNISIAGGPGVGGGAAGKVEIGGSDGTPFASEIHLLKGFSVTESADRPVAPGAGKGQLWVRTSDNALVFTTPSDHPVAAYQGINRHITPFIQASDPVATAVDGDVWIETSA